MIENHCHESKYRFEESFQKTNQSKNNNDERLSSEPLKIMLKTSQKEESHTMARSWTDNRFYQNTLDCYLFKCSQLSRSECFLDLIDSSNTQVSFYLKYSLFGSL